MRLRSGLHVAHVHGADVRVGRLAYLQLEAVEVLEHIAELAEAVGARVEVGLLLDDEVAEVREVDAAVVVREVGDGVGDEADDVVRDGRLLARGGGGFLGGGLGRGLVGLFRGLGRLGGGLLGGGPSSRRAWSVFLYLSRMTSTRMNLSQAWTKALGVFSSPMPMTYIPLSRRRMARGVKSVSEVTRTIAVGPCRCRGCPWRRIIMAVSVAFLPVV